MAEISGKSEVPRREQVGPEILTPSKPVQGQQEARTPGEVKREAYRKTAEAMLASGKEKGLKPPGTKEEWTQKWIKTSEELARLAREVGFDSPPPLETPESAMDRLKVIYDRLGESYRIEANVGTFSMAPFWLASAKLLPELVKDGVVLKPVDTKAGISSEKIALKITKILETAATHLEMDKYVMNIVRLAGRFTSRGLVIHNEEDLLLRVIKTSPLDPGLISNQFRSAEEDLAIIRQDYMGSGDMAFMLPGASTDILNSNKPGPGSSLEDKIAWTLMARCMIASMETHFHNPLDESPSKIKLKY